MYSREVNVKLRKVNGFESVRNRENYLFFDDSCEDHYDEKEFVRLASAAGHRGIGLKYYKHTLFQQNRWLGTIVLKISQIVLFKLPRDVQYSTISLRKTIDCIKSFENFLRILDIVLSTWIQLNQIV